MSTRENLILVEGYEANSSLAALQYHGMTLTSGKATVVTSAGQVGVGVLTNAPAAGGEAAICSVGVVPVVYGGAITALEPITVDANGHFVARATDDDTYCWGIALESGSYGDVRSALIWPPRNSPTDSILDGRNKVRQLRCTFDPSANAGERTAAAHAVAETLPDNAVVVRSYYFVETALTSSSTCTVSIGIPTDDVAGILAADAIGTMGTAGWHEGIQVGTAATFSEACTASRAPTFTVGTTALNAGKIILFLNYVIID